MAPDDERLVRVLVIDDDFDIQALLTLILSRAGFDVRTVDNGKEALRWMNELQPDVVLLDVQMPEMDGWETCRRIRSSSEIPIVFLTIRNGRADISRGLRLGANDYVCKPFLPSDLVARLRHLTADAVH
jgi:two-component system OmpR family response regulator